LSGGITSRLTREQKGASSPPAGSPRVWKHIPDPKPSYVADWDQFRWQQQTDADIFEHIEQLT
jgi:hypothetical protein